MRSGLPSRQPELRTILEQPVSLPEDWLWYCSYPVSSKSDSTSPSSDVLLCQAFSVRSTIAISRCRKVDSFPFDWPSFPRSSNRHHPLKILVVPVYHHISTSSLPETAGWQARISGARAGRFGGMRPYYDIERAITSQSVEHGDRWNTAQRNPVIPQVGLGFSLQRQLSSSYK